MEYFIAFYISGVALAMAKLYVPSWKLIKSVDPTNPLVVNKVIAFFIMTIGFVICLVPVTPALLSDRLRDSFCASFCNAVLQRG
jgi:hypothetical protein